MRSCPLQAPFCDSRIIMPTALDRLAMICLVCENRTLKFSPSIQIKDFEDQLEQGELDETGVEVEVPEKQPTGPSQRM